MMELFMKMKHLVVSFETDLVQWETLEKKA